MRLILRIGGSVVASPFNPGLLQKYAELLKGLSREGHESAVVVGGGALAREFIRIAKDLGLPESVQDDVAISVSRLHARLFVEMLGETGCGKVLVTIKEASHCFGRKRVAVMGGLRPGMTTDTVAALIAEKVNADLYIKATDQDGVYDKDPLKFPEAVKYPQISYLEVLSQGLGVMDASAVAMCRDNHLPIIVFNLNTTGNIMRMAMGEAVGTVIK